MVQGRRTIRQMVHSKDRIMADIHSSPDLLNNWTYQKTNQQRNLLVFSELILVRIFAKSIAIYLVILPHKTFPSKISYLDQINPL
jgi:hypothetical protein